MKLNLSRLHVVAATAALAVLAFILRAAQLAAAFDDAGMATGKGVIFFSVVTALAVILFAAYSFTLKGRKKYNAIAGKGLTEMALGVAAAILMIVSGISLFTNLVQQGDRLVAIGSIVTGICWALTAAGRYFGKKVHPLLFMVPALFYVVDLVCRFRFWTRDPIIIDYCYDLFAMISIMCATFHLGGFCFEKGGRRLTVFFCLCGVFFSAAAMVKTTAAAVFAYAAAILWLLANLWLLLRPSRKRDLEEEDTEPQEELSAEEAPEMTEEPEEMEETADAEEIEEDEEEEEFEEEEEAGDLL